MLHLFSLNFILLSPENPNKWLADEKPEYCMELGLSQSLRTSLKFFSDLGSLTSLGLSISSCLNEKNNQLI